MATIADRYDRAAARYQRWWGPVLAQTALGVLDVIAPHVCRNSSMLDIGAGTGVLAIAALERWPDLRVTGLDGSSGMLAVAGEEADRRLDRARRDRLELVTGVADKMPFADSTFDLAVSSFVFQLVPHRPRALAEARRVLRPGGRLAFVTWVAGDTPFAPDEAFYDVLDELDVDDPNEAEEARSGDFASASAAAAQLRRAGFRDVVAEAGTLEHAYDPTTYIDFLEEYAEQSTFEGLEPDLATTVRERTAERLAALPRDAFVWRAPVVTAIGRRR